MASPIPLVSTPSRPVRLAAQQVPTYREPVNEPDPQRDGGDGAALARYRCDGDQEALAQVIRRHAGLVQQVGLHLTGHASDADDVAQATFLALVRRASALESCADVGPWLHRVASHAASRVLRARRRRDHHEARGGIAMADALARSATAGSDSVCERRHAALHAAVAALPDPYRTAVVLHYFQGLSQAQAAARLGRAEKSFSVLIGRARQRLRQAMDRRGVALGLAALLALLGSAQAPAAEAAATTRYLAIASGTVPPNAAVAGLAAGLGSGGLHLPVLVTAALILVLGGVCWSWPRTTAAPGPLSTVARQEPAAAPVTSRSPSAVAVAVPGLKESSGLALSLREPDLCWSQNDLHNRPRLYGFTTTGRHRATLLLPAATAGDWEDLAAFRHRDRPCLAIADLGDNENRGRTCRILVVEEPSLTADDPATQIDTPLLASIGFVWPDGPCDANALAIDPSDGVMLVFTEGGPRTAAVACTLAWDGSAMPSVQVARPLATLIPGTVKGATISADGRRCHLLILGAIATWDRAAGENWAAAFARKPRMQRLGIAGKVQGVAEPAPGRLLLSAEGEPAQLWTLWSDPAAISP